MIRCRHFGDCGGCRFQDLEYPDQLALKQKELEALFVGSAVLPIIPADSPWYYRNKMEYTFSMDKKGERYLGLIKQGGRGRVLNIEECFLVSEWFQTTLNTVRKWWESRGLLAFHPYKNTGSLRTLTLREGKRTSDRLIMLTVSGNPEWALKQSDIDAFVADLKASLGDEHLSIFLRIQQAIKGKPTEFFEMHLFGSDAYREILNLDRPVDFKVSPSAFFQPNPSQAEKFIKIAIELVQKAEKPVVWDLYCGAGALSLAIAPYAKEVIGVELSAESIDDARSNLKLNNLKNVTFVCGDVGQVLETGKYPPPDLIVVDPPRAGLDKKALLHIIQAGAPKIIYIACNPKTQKENCLELEAAGYKMVLIQPVDQFPQTPHVENVIYLERN